MNWFRVPSWIGGRLSGGHVATDAEAWADLLGRWHQGEDVSACAFQKATGWGKGRVLAFMPKVAEWAVEAGASVPSSWVGKVTDRPTDRKRTALRTDADKVEPELPESTGPETDRPTDRKRTASCARNSSAEREETEKREEKRGGETPPPEAAQTPQVGKDTPQPEIAAPAASGAPQSAPQTIHGTQATVVLSEPPAQESPLLALLASSGLTIGQASGLARKFLENGITSLDCPEMEPLDEFDLGRIVGTQKGRVIAAFRKAGWLPPKERRQQVIPAMPPGLKVLDEKGNPIGVTPPATKQEKKAADKDDWFGTLQQLAGAGDKVNGN